MSIYNVYVYIMYIYRYVSYSYFGGFLFLNLFVYFRCYMH